MERSPESYIGISIDRQQQQEEEGSLSWGSGSSGSSTSSSRPCGTLYSVSMDDAVLPVSSHQPPSSGRRLPPEEELPRAAAVGRYSVDERRERIEKYRSKRNHRNFDKKITYACRKTLADSRPRVKGRFARNSGAGDAADGSQSTELAAVSPPPATMNTMCNDDDDDGGGGGDVPEWWPAVQEALTRQEDDDEDLLAAYLGVSSINLYSPRGHSS